MGINCGFEVRDESEDEITTAMGEHAVRIHKLVFTEALRQKARDLIRFEEGVTA